MKWLAAHDHFVEHTTETPDVAAVVYLESSRLLWRHVVRGSQYDAVTRVDEVLCGRERVSLSGLAFASEFSETKVENFNAAVAAQHDVVRLDVAMDDPDAVGRSESARDLDANVDGVEI